DQVLPIARTPDGCASSDVVYGGSAAAAASRVLRSTKRVNLSRWNDDAAEAISSYACSALRAHGAARDPHSGFGNELHLEHLRPQLAGDEQTIGRRVVGDAI